MAGDARNRKSFGMAGIVVAVVLVCLVVGALAWFGGWGFSSSFVRSPNPAPPAPITNPPAKMPVAPPPPLPAAPGPAR